jgi:ATP/maltotriose-dependent transcriptional regulator MalT
MGDEKTYADLREEMAARFKDADEVAPWRALEVGLLRPIDGGVAPIYKHFAAGLEQWSRTDTNDYWGLTLMSLLACRQGDYPQAMDLARQSFARLFDGARMPDAGLSIIVALCQNGLGDRSAALSELDRAESVIRTGFNLDYDVWHWRHWVMVRLLLREARGLLSAAPLQDPAKATR